MSYREFVIPDADQIHEQLGGRVEPGEEVGVVSLSFEDGAGGALEVVLDTLGRSVSLRLFQRER